MRLWRCRTGFLLACSKFADLRYDVAIVSFDPPGSVSFYRLSEKVTWIQLGIGKASEKSTIAEFLLRTIKIRKIIKSADTNLWIGFMHSFFIPLSIAAIGTKAKVIASEHISYDHYRTRRLERLLLSLTSIAITKYTCLSKTLMLDFPNHISKKMVPITNPIPTVTSFVKTKETKILLNVGRLEEQKDQECLLRSFSLVLEKHPDWKLRIVGEGSLHKNLQELAEKLEIKPNVHFVGVTPDITKEYEKADIFVCSSRYESFGLATIEAMSFGIPAIGFRSCPGTNEIIQNGSTGILVHGSERHSALAEAIITLIAQPEKRHKMGKAAQKHIAINYSNDSVIDLWKKIVGTQNENRPT